MTSDLQDADTERLKDILLDAVRSEPSDRAALAAAFTKFSPECVEQKQDGSSFVRVPLEQRPVVEAGLRAVLLALLREASAAGGGVMAYRGSTAAGGEQGAAPIMPRFLNCVLWLADTKSVDPVSHMGLVEDVVEVCSGSDCAAVFTYIESKTAMLRKPHFYTHQGRLCVLRMVNTLLKRLSAATAPALCGSMLLFLAKFLPISERSGVNVPGTYNVGNTTPIADVLQDATDSEGQPINGALYRLFWGLQPAFAYPPGVLQPSQWAQVVSDIRTVLAEFRHLPVSTSGALLLDESVTEEFNPKYLSSPQLLRLQLRDTEVRQQFVIQALILAHFAKQPTKDAKEGPLRAKQAATLQELEGELYVALEGSGPGGSELAALLRSILRREMHWVAWKNSGCQPLERPPVERPKAPAPPAKRPKSRVPPRQQGVVSLGSSELDELWNVTDSNSSCLGCEDRDHLPNLEEFLAPVATQMDPDPEVQGQPKIKDDPVYCWKAYRLLARQNLAVFADTITPTQPDPKPNLERAVRSLYPHMMPPAAAAAAEAPAPAKPAASTITFGSTNSSKPAAVSPDVQPSARAPAAHDGGGSDNTKPKAVPVRKPLAKKAPESK